MDLSSFSRLDCLTAVVNGFKKYGIPLVTDYENRPTLLRYDDDLGLYLYSSYISKFLSVDALSAAKILFVGLYGLFFLGMSYGFLKLSKTYISYFLILGFGVCTFMRSLKHISYLKWTAITSSISSGIYPLWKVFPPNQQLTDLYVAYMVPFIAIPFLLLAIERRSLKLYMISFAGCGLVSGFADVMRVNASLPVLVFFGIILIFTQDFKWREKGWALFLLLSCYSLAPLHLRYALHQRQEFLKTSNLPFQEDSMVGHSFWHPIYVGLGFIANKYDIQFDDGCSARHACAAEPQLPKSGHIFHLELHSKTMKKLFLNLLFKDPYFVITAMFAKVGVALFYFLLYFGWLALLLAYFVPKPWYIDGAFFCCAAIGALPGIVVMPIDACFLGLTTCTILYVMYGLLFLSNIKDFKKKLCIK